MENNFKPMSKGSAVDYVIEQIKDRLMRNVIKPGDKLPSELELCAQLGVSRGSVRSAMKVFETLGVIDIRVGDGTYVRDSISSQNLNPLIFSLLILKPGFHDIVQFREKLELDIVDLIIKDEQLTAQAVPKLEENLKNLYFLQQTNASPEAFFESDQEFHSILAKSCNNIIFETVYRYIFEFFSFEILYSHMKQSYGSVAANDHTRIYQAIKSQDFSMAKEAIHGSAASWVELTKNEPSEELQAKSLWFKT